jgi:hypothetical protein
MIDKLIWRFRKPLGKLLAGVRRVERFLGPEDDWAEDDRRILYEAADPILRPLGRPTVTEKGREDYILTTEVSEPQVEERLHDDGYERNFLSTRKYRIIDGRKQWAAGSWVYDGGGRWQHHVYLFKNEDGTTDIYGHREPSVRHPHDHVTGPQDHGDYSGRITQLFTHDANE